MSGEIKAYRLRMIIASVEEAKRAIMEAQEEMSWDADIASRLYAPLERAFSDLDVAWSEVKKMEKVDA